MPVQTPCHIDTESVAINTIDCKDGGADRSCLSMDVRLAAAPTGGEASCNALQCLAASRGNVGGMAVLARKGDCVTLECVTDRNGFMALQAGLLIYEPPEADTAIPDDDVQCLPGENVLACVATSYTSSGAIQRAGGLSGLVRDTDSINLHVTSEVRCDVPYQVVTADLITAPCERNALTVTSAGVSVSVGTTSCIELRIVVDSTTCLDTPTRTIQAFPIILPETRNFFVCTPLGFTAMVRDPKDLPVCVRLAVVDDSIGGLGTRWIEATPEICSSADNIFECSVDGLGAFVGDTCTFALSIEAGGGCGGKIVRGYIPVAQDSKPSPKAGEDSPNLRKFGKDRKAKKHYNMASAAGAGFSTMIQASTCIKPVVTQDASGVDAKGCSGLPRIMELQWIVCDSDRNAFDCGANGIGAYVDITCTVALEVVPIVTGCSGSKAMRASIIYAPDVDTTVNWSGSSTTGIATFVKASDCIKPMLYQDVGESTSTNRDPQDECFTTSRVMEFHPIIADDPANALTCSELGLAVFVRESMCVDIRVQEWDVNGIATKAILADLIIDQPTGNKQALRCGPATMTGPDGAFVAVEDTACIQLNVAAGEAGIDAIQGKAIPAETGSTKTVDPTKGIGQADVYNNAVDVRGNCLGATSGLAVVFRDLGCVNANINFGTVPAPCGGTDVVACVVLATNGPRGCNGLQALPNGLWGPPSPNAWFGYASSEALQQIGPPATTDSSAVTASGPSGAHGGPKSGAPCILPQTACNPITSGRDAMAMVWVQAPAVYFELYPSANNALAASASYGVEIGTTAAPGSTKSGQAARSDTAPNYASFQVPGAIVDQDNHVSWKHPWVYMSSGQTAVYIIDRLKPGVCVTCTLTPSVSFAAGGASTKDTAPSVTLLRYSVQAVVLSTL